MKQTFVIFHISIILILPSMATFLDCLPCQCDQDSQNGGVDVVCSDLNLTSVPLTLPDETTNLRLDGNMFSSFPPNTFSRMENLKNLDLSRNLIQRLDDNVFHGLHNLEYLNLDLNQLISICDYVFVPKFLLPLKGLLVLSILKQNRDCYIMLSANQKFKYFGYVFPPSLKELYIDCWFCGFSSSFSTLSRLSLLSFSSNTSMGNCFINEISQDTFKNFPHLETLNISDCQVNRIFSDAFLPLTKLRILDMSVFLLNEGDFDAFANATMSLQHLPIEVIKFQNMNNIYVKENIFMFLRNSSLKELYVKSLLYALVKPTTFRYLPQTLQVFSFQHFQYPNSKVFEELQGYHSLHKIDFSSMVLPDDDVCTLEMIPTSISTYICNDCRCPNFLGGAPPGDWLLPSIPMSLRKKNIRKLIINRNRIEYIALFILYCDSIEHMDLQDNSLYGVDQDFFHINNSVLYLNLAKNRLSKFLEDKYLDLFGRLSKLEFIDLSDNGISFLPLNIFQFSNNIRVINISNNNLQVVEIRLRQFFQLEILDLSNNKLHEVFGNTRKELENIPNATLRLSGNPLVCGCEELDFLRWVQRNPHRVQDLSSLRCRQSKDQSYETLDNLDQIIGDLNELCRSNTVEISVSVCVTICVLAVIVVYLGYRHRWKLRYLYHVGRRGYRRRYNVINDNEIAYEYDAFVSYADEDRRFVIDEMIPELEEKCGLKLCIHQRDFLPGEVIATNIVSAIQNSRKTLIILSPAFIESTWCEFEYNMARMEGVSRREDIVLVVLYEHVPVNVLPKDMAVLLRHNCYIEYNDVFNKEVFWYNVHESINANRPVD